MRPTVSDDFLALTAIALGTVVSAIATISLLRDDQALPVPSFDVVAPLPVLDFPPSSGPVWIMVGPEDAGTGWGPPADGILRGPTVVIAPTRR